MSPRPTPCSRTHTTPEGKSKTVSGNLERCTEIPQIIPVVSGLHNGHGESRRDTPSFDSESWVEERIDRLRPPSCPEGLGSEGPLVFGGNFVVIRKTPKLEFYTGHNTEVFCRALELGRPRKCTCPT